jgi:hypothetical protein
MMKLKTARRIAPTIRTGFSLMRVRIRAAGIAMIDMPTAREEFTRPMVLSLNPNSFRYKFKSRLKI